MEAGTKRSDCVHDISSIKGKDDNTGVSVEERESAFWSGLAKKARSVLLEDGSPYHNSGKFDDQEEEDNQNERGQVGGFQDGLQKGLDTIVGTLSMIGEGLGNALEEGIQKLERASELKILGMDGGTSTRTPAPSRQASAAALQRLGLPLKERPGGAAAPGSRPSTLRMTPSPVSSSDSPRRSPASASPQQQLKASRDVATAMAVKSKQLLKELKTAQKDLETCRKLCSALEQENRQLRSGSGVPPPPPTEEDDLVRKQLEILLKEKQQLAQEKATLERENEALHLLIDYHHLREQEQELLMPEDAPEEDDAPLKHPEEAPEEDDTPLKQPDWGSDSPRDQKPTP